jgi:hypothetical protein
MIEIEAALPQAIDAAAVPAMIEKICEEAGLTRTLFGALKSHPGSLHWHYKQGTGRGTLEITWIEASRRLWFAMQDGRSAEWIEPAMVRLKARLEQPA